jgi:hypothetical protein
MKPRLNVFVLEARWHLACFCHFVGWVMSPKFCFGNHQSERLRNQGDFRECRITLIRPYLQLKFQSKILWCKIEPLAEMPPLSDSHCSKLDRRALGRALRHDSKKYHPRSVPRYANYLNKMRRYHARLPKEASTEEQPRQLEDLDAIAARLCIKDMEVEGMSETGWFIP